MSTRRRIAIVTGTRAEFGLLRPVMASVREHAELELLVIAAGSHLISPAESYRDVKAEFGESIADAIPMQVAGRTGRLEDAEALGVGIARMARCFGRLSPDWVVVLGDRIEAFAGASAASVGGFALAHIHGGDRAEGVADESMRHAITKLAHLHLAATAQSGERLRRLGERPDLVFVVGSPAIDGLDAIAPLPDPAFRDLGAPDTVLLLHPAGRAPGQERGAAEAALAALRGRRVLAFHPNHDPGRDGTFEALSAAADLRLVTHLARDRFIGLLKRLADGGGVMVGNSSAALIEAAALRLPAVDIGPRQAGRERAANAVHADETAEDIARALEEALRIDRAAIAHPYGDGRAGPAIAARLAGIDPREPGLLRKRCVY